MNKAQEKKLYEIARKIREGHKWLILKPNQMEAEDVVRFVADFNLLMGYIRALELGEATYDDTP